MMNQDIIDEAVRLVNEVEVLRKAIVHTDGRTGTLYHLVQDFKEAKRKLNYHMARWGNIGSVREEIEDALRETDLVVGGDLTPEQERKFKRALVVVHPDFKHQPIPLRAKRFNNHFYPDRDI